NLDPIKHLDQGPRRREHMGYFTDYLPQPNPARPPELLLEYDRGDLLHLLLLDSQDDPLAPLRAAWAGEDERNEWDIWELGSTLRVEIPPSGGEGENGRDGAAPKAKEEEK